MLDLLKSDLLISRKIRVAGKLLNSLEYFQSKFPIRLTMSVRIFSITQILRENIFLSYRTHLKDTTPDSGVVADNSHSNSNQSTTSSQNVGKITSKSTKEGSSQNSLLSR